MGIKPYLSPKIRAARSSRRYQKWRRAILRGEPLCRLCRRAGYTVAAAELDHIEPLHLAPGRLMDPANVQPLCRDCHERKTAGELRPETPEQRAWRQYLDTFQEEESDPRGASTTAGAGAAPAAGSPAPRPGGKILKFPGT